MLGGGDRSMPPGLFSSVGFAWVAPQAPSVRAGGLRMPDPGDGPVIAVPRKRVPDGHVVAHGRRNGVCRHSLPTGLLSSRAVTLPPPRASPSRLGRVCCLTTPNSQNIHPQPQGAGGACVWGEGGCVHGRRSPAYFLDWPSAHTGTTGRARARAGPRRLVRVLGWE